MSIKDLKEKIKRAGESARLSVGSRLQYAGTLLRAGRFERYYMAAVVILVGLASFGLGRLSILEGGREPITIDQTYESASAVAATIKEGSSAPAAAPARTEAARSGGAGAQAIVASKNGTKYYFTWCAGADRISPANKIFFHSENEAKARGLAPAANCKGLGN